MRDWKGGMQDRWDEGPEGCMKLGIHERRDTRKEECRTGGMQDLARLEGCRNRGMQGMRDARKEG